MTQNTSPHRNMYFEEKKYQFPKKAHYDYFKYWQSGHGDKEMLWRYYFTRTGILPIFRGKTLRNSRLIEHILYLLWRFFLRVEILVFFSLDWQHFWFTLIILSPQNTFFPVKNISPLKIVNTPDRSILSSEYDTIKFYHICI